MLERAAISRRSFADDVQYGLTQPQKELQPWYFYDGLGSALFAAICELPEYYLTRAETEILQRNASAIVGAFGTVDRVIELGSGDGRKTRLLLEPIAKPFTYVPIDVDASVLEASARDLLSSFPAMHVDAICADYREIATLIAPAPHTVVLFLGSSIGNLDPASAAAMFRQVRSILTPGNSIFLGADLQKSKEIIEPAYNDSLGVTASFTMGRRKELVDELAPYREPDASNHPWGQWHELDAHEGKRMPGGASRWNAGKDLSFELLRPELVCEVAYDHMQGDRLRHAATFRRWRPDRVPGSCTYDQLEVAVPALLSDVFGAQG